ncbi:MAG: hypothetical protein KDD25_10020, partial [Bdellovibrionales bacterium]|nr:hypothetical protein [Bdellovibrionales bacterium]
LIRHRPDIKIIVRTHYLRDSKKLHLDKSIDLVVGEFETSLEILKRTLVSYGVKNTEIREYLESAQEHMTQLAQNKSLKTSILDKHGIEFLSQFGTVKLRDTDFGVGKSIEELQIRNITGATIIGIFNEGLGPLHPAPDYVLKDNDIVYFIGGTEQLRLAESFLQKAHDLA